MEELGGKDIEDVIKEMEDTEFRSNMEAKLPAYNTRVKLPTVNERLPGFDGQWGLFLLPSICVIIALKCSGNNFSGWSDGDRQNVKVWNLSLLTVHVFLTKNLS